MEFGEGIFVYRERKFKGKILLDTKLYICGEKEYVETYIPLEKIERVKLRKNRIEIDVTPSIVSAYTVVIYSDKKNLKKLAHFLAEKLGLKKKILKSEWYGKPYSR